MIHIKNKDLYFDIINNMDDSVDTLKEIIDYIKNNKLTDITKYPYQSNCPNCGAPVTSSVCEYCDTRFY